MSELGAIVADVDMTIINDGSSVLSGLNLQVLIQALRRDIPILFISGSPYDSVYCNVTTTGALSRRVANPIRETLRIQNVLDKMVNLKIFYASGRGTVSFDALGNEIRLPDETDKDIAPDLQSLLFRGFLIGFYSIHKNSPQENYPMPSVDSLWAFKGTDDHAAERTRKIIQNEIGLDVGTLEKWSFGSESVNAAPLILGKGRDGISPSKHRW